MPHILLTGAGFSRNWGGWLVNEAFEYLLTAKEVDDQLRRVLWQDKFAGFNFEYTLARLQKADKESPNPNTTKLLHDLNSALAGMFNYMSLGFLGKPFEFQSNLTYMVRNFLIRFDAIFTLNQDLLLEQKYLDDNISLTTTRSWSGWQIPGTRFIGNSPIQGNIHDRTQLREPDTSKPFVEQPRMQPYYKLHGSSNFVSSTGRMLIMGGNKVDNIATHPLLEWYTRQFSTYLHRTGCRLMIIGYSFSDEHINSMVCKR